MNLKNGAKYDFFLFIFNFIAFIFSKKLHFSLKVLHIILKERDSIVKIIIFTIFAFLAPLSVIGGERRDQAVSRYHRGRVHMDKNHSHNKRFHNHHTMHKKEGKRSEMIFENLNKEQQALYSRIHDLQKNIRKNMYALGQERRNIKNLKTNEDRKKSQENINKICNEIKQNIEEHQPRIVEAIGDLK